MFWFFLLGYLYVSFLSLFPFLIRFENKMFLGFIFCGAVGREFLKMWFFFFKVEKKGLVEFENNKFWKWVSFIERQDRYKKTNKDLKAQFPYDNNEYILIWRQKFSYILIKVQIKKHIYLYCKRISAFDCVM